MEHQTPRKFPKSVSAEAKSVLAQRWTVEKCNRHAQIIGDEYFGWDIIIPNHVPIWIEHKPIADALADAHNASVLAQEKKEEKE